MNQGATAAKPGQQPSIHDFPYHTFDKIRYGDTDRQGHVNNAVFTSYLETGRVELLYDPVEPFPSPGGEFVIVHVTLDLRAEINWPGRVDIGTRIARVGRSSVTLQQGLFQGGRCVATAETVIVQIEKITRRSQPFSATAVQRFEAMKRSVMPDK